MNRTYVWLLFALLSFAVKKCKHQIMRFY